VQYKTCWIDNKLGSASKFFDKDEEDDNENNIDNSNSNNMSIMSKSQSCFFNKRKKKDENDKDSFSSDDSDDSNYDGLALKRNISKDLLKIKNNKDNNSQEFKKRKNSKALTKYYNDFRDDSYMIKESNLSKQFNEENNNYNMQQSDYSYNSHYAKYFFILMEYCDGLTLDLYIKQHANSSIDRKIIYSFTQQLLKSLSKIHSGGIIHRDIKPSNIFIKNDQIKIGDFGLATRYNTSKLLRAKKIEGTPLYLSPEQKNSKIYNEKVDIYALGITLYEICSSFSTSM
jgi:serine/threonine protein kinase